MTAFKPLDASRPDFPNESDLVQLMCQHIRHIERYWVEDSASLGHFGSLDMAEWAPPGGPINEEVVRSMAQELMGYAVLYQSPHFDAALAGVDRATLLDRLNRCLRWNVAYHLVGDRHTAPLTSDGQWGDDWESSLWAAQLAMAAHWVWAALDADVREGMLRMMAFEGDRFLGVDPPDGRWLDTKAEENAWDSLLLAWAYCLQPDHPHAAAWLDRGKAFAMNTFTTNLAQVDTSLIDGRPVREWVCTQTAHPDLTVENHGSFHPNYLGCGGLLMDGRQAFQATGLEPPPHYLYRVLEVWDILKSFYLANGFATYPSGQDWGYHGAGVNGQAAAMALEFGDEIAGHLFWESVRHADEAMRFAGDGRFDGRIPHAPGGRFFQFETGGMGALAGVVMGGVPRVRRLPDDEFRRRQARTASYPFVWLQLRRTRQGLFSFCWRSLAQKVMGLAIPAGGEAVLGAEQDGLVGRIDLDGQPAQPVAACHTDHTDERGFRTTGEVDYGRGQVTQRLAVVALPDGETALVIDLTTARPGARVTRNEGLGVYVMNDFTDGNRVRIAHAGGGQTVRGVGGTARVIATGSPWMRVAGCLGLATSGEPLYYEDAAERNTPIRWRSVLQDRVFTQPVARGETLRDYATVVRLGRAGARRATAAPVRLACAGEWVRAYRVTDARGHDVTVVANLGRQAVTATVEGAGALELAAMDTVVI